MNADWVFVAVVFLSAQITIFMKMPVLSVMVVKMLKIPFYSRRKRNKEYCCKLWEKSCRTSNMVRVQFYFHEFTEVGLFQRCMFTFLSPKLRRKIRTTFYLAPCLSYTSATMSIYDHYKFFEAARCRFCWKKGTSFQKRKSVQILRIFSTFTSTISDCLVSLSV